MFPKPDHKEARGSAREWSVRLPEGHRTPGKRSFIIGGHRDNSIVHLVPFTLAFTATFTTVVGVSEPKLALAARIQQRGNTKSIGDRRTGAASTPMLNTKA